MSLLHEWLNIWINGWAAAHMSMARRASVPDEVGNVKTWIEHKSKSRETAKRAWAFYQQLTELLEPEEVRFSIAAAGHVFFSEPQKNFQNRCQRQRPVARLHSAQKKRA